LIEIIWWIYLASYHPPYLTLY